MVIEYFLDWIQTASVAKRVDAAVALARACTRSGITPEERDEIEAALTVLLEDNAASVRLAIAETLGAFSTAPRHIINALANDNEDISIIVLSQSSVFHDAELVNFVRRGSEKNQIAISCRPWLSAELVSALCHYGCKDAVLGVLTNSAAEFTSHDLHIIAERHGVSTDIRHIITKRDDLPAETRHLLLGKLGQALGNFVKDKAWLPENRLQKAIGEATDRASIILAAKTRDEEVVKVVRNLIEQDRLTLSFLVRAICMGNITLVASAFSELSGIRFSRVEAILTNNRQSAFKAVYDRAGLPKPAFVIFQIAISTWRKVLASESKLDKARLPFIVTREVLDGYLSATDNVSDELLVLLRKLSVETARESSIAKAVEISSRKAEVAEIYPSEHETLEIASQQPQIKAEWVDENKDEPNLKAVDTLEDTDLIEVDEFAANREAATRKLDETFAPTVIAA